MGFFSEPKNFRDFFSKRGAQSASKMQSVVVMALLYWVEGCASFNGSHQWVSVDSSPRGQQLYGMNGNVLGETPLFVEIPRGASYHLKTGGVGPLKELKFECSYRLFQSGIFNFPILGQLVDLSTGAAWTCPPVLKLPSEQNSKLQNLQVPKPKPECRTLAVIYPSLSDLSLVENLSSRWYQEYFKKRSREGVECDIRSNVFKTSEMQHRFGLQQLVGLNLEDSLKPRT